MTYRLPIDVGAVARGIFKDDDHATLIIELAHDLAVFPGESRVEDLYVIVWHAAHREYLVEDLDTFHLPRDAIEFCPDLPGDGVSLV